MVEPFGLGRSTKWLAYMVSHFILGKIPLHSSYFKV